MVKVENGGNGIVPVMFPGGVEPASICKVGNTISYKLFICVRIRRSLVYVTLTERALQRRRVIH